MSANSDQCPACNGSCTVENSQKQMQTCPVCGGSGIRKSGIRDGLIRSGGAQPGESFAK